MSCSEMNSSYAVIQFLSDSTFSEVPTNWLTRNGDTFYCWWPPRSSNNATLIAKRANPNYTLWSNFEVDLIKYCTSLESARKSAADSNYSTTDEERLGRGKRPRIPYKPFNSDDELEKNTCGRKKNRIQPNISESMPSCPENFEFYKYIQDAGSSGSRNEAATSQFETNSKNGGTFARAQELSTISLQDVPVLIQDASQLTPLQTQENFNIQETLKEIKRLVATCNVTLRDNTERLKKIEDVIRRGYSVQQSMEDNNFIVEFFPLNQIEDIKNIEDILKTNKEAATLFKRFILKIGGNNPKDNIHRILKNIFTNKCATDCSWKGKKDNFKICDLQLIKIIKREVVSRYATFTETETENIVAEWLRFAKQRYQRETKNNKENVPDENEDV